ncbi:MAG: hypothetical protein HWE09_03105 [Cyclobacteriaceae bacterium]|nr:hypothetical protein [Cyclobacteriaceae bacterium]
MLGISKEYNDKMRENYPEGFELDESHKPHITVIQAFIDKSDLVAIEKELQEIISAVPISERSFIANGLYYIPYENKGLAGITIEKDNLMDFHNQVIEMMSSYSIANGTGEAFVPRPDGENIMQPTVDYVNSFVPMASGEKFNPHVTIGTAFEDFVKSMLEEPFTPFTFNIQSVSIYQLGELGTAQKQLLTIEF